MKVDSYCGPMKTGNRAIIECKGAPDTAVLLILGQSNAANTLDSTTEGRDGAVNFNLFNGKCYRAQDPLLGASNSGGNFATLLGNLLIDRGHYKTVILAPIAVGGTYIAQWAPGGEHSPRITTAIQRLKEARLEPTHVLWHQGEANRLDPPETYRQAFLGVLSTIRSAGVASPVYVAQATICNSLWEDGEAMRATQRGLVSPDLGVRAGPDTDQLGAEFRYDGCHFSGEGGKRVADLWLAALLEAR